MLSSQHRARDRPSSDASQPSQAASGRPYQRCARRGRLQFLLQRSFEQLLRILSLIRWRCRHPASSKIFHDDSASHWQPVHSTWKMPFKICERRSGTRGRRALRMGSWASTIAHSTPFRSLG
jgi:hypothetical protein